MMSEPTPSLSAARLERTYIAPVALVWEMLTTAAGLERWWAPEGFDTRVTDLDLRPGGQVRYTLTATGPDQVAFVQSIGLPLCSEFHRTFTEVAAPARMAYLSLIDFVPGQEPYEHLTVVEIEPAGARTNVVMTLDPLHDQGWTQDYRDHRDHELDKLEAAIRATTLSGR
jgi:uncharacterized protein YndB with AHSA1/START domain